MKKLFAKIKNLFKKKPVKVAMLAMFVLPCAVMLTACGGKVFGNGNNNNSTQSGNTDKILTKVYDASNCSNYHINWYGEDEYEDIYNYYFHPTYTNASPFKSLTFTYNTEQDNFYSYSWNTPQQNSNGTFSFIDRNMTMRVGFSFTLYQVDEQMTRVSMSLNNEMNNSTASNSRSINNQTVTHNDKLTIHINHKGAIMTYADVKLELPFDEPLSNSPVWSNQYTNTIYYNTTESNANTFFDYKFVY